MSWGELFDRAAEYDVTRDAVQTALDTRRDGTDESGGQS